MRPDVRRFYAPVLEKHREAVIAFLEAKTRKYSNHPVKAGRREVVEMYLAGRGVVEIARAFGVSPSAVGNILDDATYRAKRMEGIWQIDIGRGSEPPVV